MFLVCVRLDQTDETYRVFVNAELFEDPAVREVGVWVSCSPHRAVNGVGGWHVFQKVFLSVDLATIMRHLSEGDYGYNPARMAADFRIVVANVRCSQPPGSSLFVAASEMHRRFEVRSGGVAVFPC
jgi:hypothetical protein